MHRCWLVDRKLRPRATEMVAVLQAASDSADQAAEGAAPVGTQGGDGNGGSDGGGVYAGTEGI